MAASETTTQRSDLRTLLEGPRLLLRFLKDSDVTDEYISWLNDREVTRYMSGSGHVRATRETLRAYLRRFQGSRTDFIFAIVERATGRHIGNVTLNRIHPVHGTADTGLMIGRKEAWGKGYAFEAWSLLMRFAFGERGVRKLTAGVAAENLASSRTFQKLGFRLEGILRQDIRVEDTYQDVLLFGLLRDEY